MSPADGLHFSALVIVDNYSHRSTHETDWALKEQLTSKHFSFNCPPPFSWIRPCLLTLAATIGSVLVQS